MQGTFKHNEFACVFVQRCEGTVNEGKILRNLPQISQHHHPTTLFHTVEK